jgi:hypothetical protein
MKKIAYTLLLPLLLAACKKDNKPHVFTGILLNKTTQTPVAGASITLVFVNFNGSRVYTILNYDGTTDEKGQYAIEVTDIGNRGEYNIVGRKAGMVQLRNSMYNRPITPPYKDTTLLDNAAYVSIKHKVAAMIGTESSQFLVWELLQTEDDRTDIEISLQTDKRLILSTMASGTIVNALDSFTYADHTKIFIEQFIGTTTSKRTIVKKIVPLLPRDTTFIDLQ